MDRELVLRARGGEQAAFTALAGAAIGRLHRTARLILRDEERAADAVQETLVTAWLDIRALRDPDRFEAWLYRLLVRACYREAGRDRRDRTIEVRLAGIGQPLEAPGSDLADRDYLERGFRRLTPEHRAVLVLRHYVGLADEPAADVLGIPPGTYKSRLNRATTALRAALEAEDRAAARGQEALA